MARVVLVLAGLRRGRATPAMLLEGLALLPVLGALQGLAAAAASAVFGSRSPFLSALAGIIVLEAIAGGRPGGGLGSTAALVVSSGAREQPGLVGRALQIVVLMARVWGLVALPTPTARRLALVLAPLLGRWAMVVECHGGPATHARGPAAAIVGRARFREFGCASVVALGATQALAGGVGVLLVLVAALVAVGFRVLVHRRLGGFTGRLLWAADALVETAVVGTLGCLARFSLS